MFKSIRMDNRKWIIDYNAAAITSEQIKFKGFAVGNALTSWTYDITNALLDFAFTHSLYITNQIEKNVLQ